MAEAVMLGTGRAVPSPSQENTYFALLGQNSALLIDCAGSPYRRLQKAQIDPARISALIITHFHPDHVYGLPSLLLSLWLVGRKTPLDLYGPEAAIHRAEQMMELYGYGTWPGMYPVHYHPIALTAGAAVLSNEDFEVTAAPGVHVIPAVGLRVRDKRTGAIFAYSSDTEPAPPIEELARGARLLIHEATGENSGHSSAEQAGSVAQKAGVQQLALIHYDPAVTPPRQMLRDARRHFNGRVSLARDFRRFEW